MLGAVHEENVFAIVDLVGEGHVVEGTDNRWLNTAGSWNMVASQLKGSNLKWGGEDGSWEDRQWAEDSHQTEVLQDGLPLQLLGLLKLSSKLDGVHVSRLAERKLALKGSSQWLLKNLLNGPPVLQDWAGKGSLHGDGIGLALDWGNLNSRQNGALRLLASNNDGVDLLDLGAGGSLDHTSDLKNV